MSAMICGIREIEQLSTPTDGPVYVKTRERRDRGVLVTLDNFPFEWPAAKVRREFGTEDRGLSLTSVENYAAAARFCRGEALDVCTYQGGFALHLARVCEKVTGVDSSRAALESRGEQPRSQPANGWVLPKWIGWRQMPSIYSATGAIPVGNSIQIVLDPPRLCKIKASGRRSVAWI